MNRAMNVKSGASILFLDVFSIWVITFVTASNNAVQSRWERDTTFDDLIPLETSLGARFPVTTATQCAMHCLGLSECFAFLFNEDTEDCILYPALNDSAANGAVASPGSACFKLVLDRCPEEDSYVIQVSTNTCYKIHTDDVKLNWNQSRDQCEEQGERLVVLDDTDKADFLTDFLLQNYGDSRTNFWIGAHRPFDMFNTPLPTSGSDYAWLNGKAVNMTTAQSYLSVYGLDNAAGRENVLMMWGDKDYAWNDEREYFLLNYICEKPFLA